MPNTNAPISEPLFLNPDGTRDMQSVVQTAAWIQWLQSLTNQGNTSAAGIVSPATTVTDETTFGVDKVVGTKTTYAREDHNHGTPAALPTTQTDVTDSRAIGTVYHNTTGNPMLVTVTLMPIAASQMGAYTDSSTPPTTIVGNISAGSLIIPMTFVVLTNNYYKVDFIVNVGGSIYKWLEWS